MNVAKLILGFAPWIAYTVIVNWAGPTSVPIAALVALAIAVALIVADRPARRHAPRFRAVNRRISAAWGVGVLVMALAHTLAGLLENPAANLLLNWGVPIAVFVIVLGYPKRTAAARHQNAS